MRLVSDQEILAATSTSVNMAEARAKTGLTNNAFKSRALALGVFNPTGKNAGRKVPLEEILDGLHPHYQTFKLRNRLIDEGVKTNACEMPACSVEGVWLGEALQCQLDHINGDSRDHRRVNLRMLCPNCHSQTETFSGKKKRLH